LAIAVIAATPFLYRKLEADKHPLA